MSALEDRLLCQIRAVKLPEPVRELRFNAQRRWKADFGWPEHRLLVEVEGGTFMRGGGRHNRGAGMSKDASKYNAAVLGGWRLLRFTPDMIRDGSALATLETALGQNLEAR